MKKLIFERGALKILKNGVRNHVQLEKTVRHANFQRCIQIFAWHFLKPPDYFIVLSHRCVCCGGLKVNALRLNYVISRHFATDLCVQ